MIKFIILTMELDMLINFRYHNTKEIIKSCSHQSCLTINKGDSIMIDKEMLIVIDKIYINPHTNQEVNLFCAVLN